jgi:hypothetical protein
MPFGYSGNRDNTEGSSGGGGAGLLSGGGILGLVLSGVGAAGALFGNNDYDPSRNALKQFYELTNPNSDYFRRYRALYGRLLSDAAPSLDTLLGLATAGGASPEAASSLAFRQGAADAKQREERLLNAADKQFLDSQELASKYLSLEYGRASAEEESEGSFFDQLLGLGGGILAKVL